MTEEKCVKGRNRRYKKIMGEMENVAEILSKMKMQESEENKSIIS